MKAVYYFIIYNGLYVHYLIFLQFGLQDVKVCAGIHIVNLSISLSMQVLYRMQVEDFI